ncbi:hypothetical protein ACE1SV_64850 [Streptomyces sp. E-15]
MTRRTPLGILAVIGAAILIPVTLTGPAHADNHQPAPGQESGTRIVLGKPQKIHNLNRQDVSRDPGLRAVNCGVNTTNHDRLSSCSNWRIPVQFLTNGRPSGSATLYSKATAKLDPRNRYEWTQKVALRLTNPSRPEAWAVSGTIELATSHATATPVGAATQVLFPYTTHTFTFRMSSPGRDLVSDSIVPYGRFKAPGFDDGSAYLGDVFRPRCDNTRRITDARYGGCVYPDVPAIWQLDVTDPDVDAVAWHVDWAQRHLKHPWGVPKAGWNLHRTFNQTLQRDNRRTACGRDVPRPPGRPDLTCDEFPFAQTYEGASRNSDYSCHFLDRDDNSKEGSLRKAFLNGMRTLENDAFQVQVINKPSATAVAPPALRGPVGCGSD